MNQLSWKRKLVNGVADCLIKVSGVDHPSKSKSILLERMNPSREVLTKYGPLKFSCPNELIWWRVDTFHSKEPETLRWIDSMEQDSVFFDIGANIGLYSLYAGKKGLQVTSFEPEALNYSELTKNIFLNKLSNINPVNFALNCSDQLVTFRTSSSTAGTALQTSGLTTSAKFDFKQTTYGTSVDQLIEKFKFKVPNYVKIDVDGPEFSILQGMSQTLLRKELVSVLIEIDEKDCHYREILKLMESSGFKLLEKTDTGLRIDNYIFKRIV